MIAPSPPVAIGCVRCGREAWPDKAVWAQCEVCGKTCGFCESCALGVSLRDLSVPLLALLRAPSLRTQKAVLRFVQRFIDESMEWHEVERHGQLPRWERRRLDKMPKSAPTVELC